MFKYVIDLYRKEMLISNVYNIVKKMSKKLFNDKLSIQDLGHLRCESNIWYMYKKRTGWFTCFHGKMYSTIKGSE